MREFVLPSSGKYPLSDACNLPICFQLTLFTTRFSSKLDAEHREYGEDGSGAGYYAMGGETGRLLDTIGALD